MVLVFDASALITTARFEIMGTPILDYIIACCQLAVPQTVKVEVVDAGLQGGYADAALLGAADRVRRDSGHGGPTPAWRISDRAG